MILISFPSSRPAQGVPDIYSRFCMSPFTFPPLLPSVCSFLPPNLIAAEWKREEPVFGLRKVHEKSQEMAENDGCG